MRIAIGDVTAQWSFLEYQVGQIVHELLSLGPKPGRVVTTQMNLRPKLEIIELLFTLTKTDAALVDYFGEINEAINIMHTERNMIIHGLWTIPPNSREHHLVSYTGKKENRIIGKAVPMTAQHIRFVAANLDNINLHLSRFVYGLRIGELPPSPNKLPTLPQRPESNRSKDRKSKNRTKLSPRQKS